MTRRTPSIEKQVADIRVRAGRQEPETEEEAIHRRMAEVLSDLSRRLSRATEVGKGIQLDAAEMDLMAMHGALAAITEAATKALVEVATQRVMRRLASEVARGW